MENDFIVGFTIFTSKGFKTMYRHFQNLETAKLFASNVNIKDNCKIYVDLDYYKNNIKEKEKQINYYKKMYEETNNMFLQNDNHIPHID